MSRIIKKERKKELGVGFVTKLYVGDDIIRITPANKKGVRSIYLHKYDPELSRIFEFHACEPKASYKLDRKDSLKNIIKDIDSGMIVL